MQHFRGVKHFDIIPQSFLLPTDFKELCSAHNKCRGPWIVKPVASSRGRGIFIVNSVRFTSLDGLETFNYFFVSFCSRIQFHRMNKLLWQNIFPIRCVLMAISVVSCFYCLKALDEKGNL